MDTTSGADVPPVQRKRSEKQRRLGPAPIASFEMSFDDSTNEVRSKVCTHISIQLHAFLLLSLHFSRYPHILCRE